jgi:hypothetical protein
MGQLLARSGTDRMWWVTLDDRESPRSRHSEVAVGPYPTAHSTPKQRRQQVHLKVELSA